MARINFSKSAEKFFLKLKISDKKKITKTLDRLSKNPLQGEKLKGEYEGLYRLVAWPYRIIYSFDSKNNTIEVVTIGHRQEVYK